MNILFKTKYDRKRIICDRNKRKATRITVEIDKTNKNPLLHFNQKVHVNCNLQIIYGYHFLTNHSLIL